MLKIVDDIAFPYSPSVNSDVNRSLGIMGMGPRTLDNTKGDSWEELMLMVSSNQDRSAFKRLFNHFAPRIKSFLMKAGADPTMAEECSQEAMATVWNKAKLFDPARASASTWIFTIARNKRIDAIRKIRRPEPDELMWPDGMEDAQDDALELKQQSEILADAIQNLPEKQRQLVEKAFFKELSHSEIALETGLPLGTIKSRIRLALERLRHAMG
jgi:RNA polymerase sigma-70 factor (ECF subfamily)